MELAANDSPSLEASNGLRRTTGIATRAMSSALGTRLCSTVYRELVPETARLLADWGMGPETIVYLDHYSARNGTWYALFSDAIDGRETPWLFLADIHQLFPAHAWIAKTDPNRLVRYVDVPYARVGDLFHMHKLAETIKAVRGIEYRRHPRF